MILVLLDNLLEILILTLRNFTKVPVFRYLGVCNVLRIWSVPAIPDYRLYDSINPVAYYKYGIDMLARNSILLLGI